MSTSDSAQSLFETLLAEQGDQSLPPVAQWQPEREGSIDIRIARDGSWIHEGDPIRREALVKLFSTVLRRDGDDFFLVTPVEKLAIEVEDAPFIGVLLEVDRQGSDAQRLLITTNVGEHVLVDGDHPLRVDDNDGEPAPYVEVRDGLEALINRTTFYRLVDIAEPVPGRDGIVGVRSCGQWFELGQV